MSRPDAPFSNVFSRLIFLFHCLQPSSQLRIFSLSRRASMPSASLVSWLCIAVTWWVAPILSPDLLNKMPVWDRSWQSIMDNCSVVLTILR
ncbi:hypothetical protein PAXRUDRAFT_604639 [Paxillus rubicundulus Ve08.2h10]|uniref:Uncharacterized protein n=1 Tax=Paxillus rubicundulus Ve08.2h10 TaxID=930991 RepID=A0A0D0E458_9AGAM|nr:hypothetical protein PAXRUDRAFT_604639 [Paxillus rubicundulus Ve08.2h10]